MKNIEIAGDCKVISEGKGGRMVRAGGSKAKETINHLATKRHKRRKKVGSKEKPKIHLATKRHKRRKKNLKA